MKKRPVREFKIDPENGSWVSAIAITTTPAIQSNFLAFETDSKEKFTAFKERKELLGIAMKADEKIYRNSKELGEYDGFFSAETIRLISQIYFKKGFANNLNIEHTNLSANSCVFQSFIIDSKLGINSPNGLDAKDGDWVIGVKCYSDEVYEILKETKAGFSVEGIFDLIEAEFLADEIILTEYFNALSKIKAMQ